MPGEIVPDETLRDKSREWGEAEYLAAFEHLHHLQGKLDDLRTSIPELISTFEYTHAAPEDLYGSFERAASSAIQAVKDLKGSWKDEKTRRIFDHATFSISDPEEQFVNIRQWDWDIDSMLGRDEDRIQEDWIEVKGVTGVEEIVDTGAEISSKVPGPLLEGIQKEAAPRPPGPFASSQR